MSRSAHHPYHREIVEKSDNLLIESKCARCGFRIVGSATGTLRQDEKEHAERCPKMRGHAGVAKTSSR